MAARGGEPFSLRAWVRGGSGSLWMPYAANETAALRGLISCWMNIAIFETLSLAPSMERRIWFQIDEMDALGRIEGLTKYYGVSIAIGSALERELPEFATLELDRVRVVGREDRQVELTPAVRAQELGQHPLGHTG